MTAGVITELLEAYTLLKIICRNSLPTSQLGEIRDGKASWLGPPGPYIDAQVVYPLASARHITEIVLKVHGKSILSPFFVRDIVAKHPILAYPNFATSSVSWY